MLTPAALVDITGDSISDIVIATFNSKVIAFDGSNYKPIWNVTFEKSESYSTISVGYYNEDNIPDFLVKYQYGKGFPVYEYEKTVVLSGKDGSKISKALTDSIGKSIFAYRVRKRDVMISARIPRKYQAQLFI